MANKTTGLKNIAYSLNISINTVSRALRDCDDISDATKQKVREKAIELGYLPNNVSQFVKRDGKELIGIVTNSFDNPYFSIVFQKLVNIINEYDYDFTVVFTSSNKLTVDVVKQCISQRVTGLITMLEVENDAVQTLKLNNIPIVLVGRRGNNDYVDEVLTNDEEGGRLVANYLVNYHKIRKCIYVKIKGAECSKRRQKSFENCINEYFPNEKVKVLTEAQANNQLVDLINQGYTGIFCFCDQIAYRIIKQLNEYAPNFRKIYPRVHIIGYDCVSTRIAGMVDITSIDSDYDGVCQTAVMFLNNKLSKKVKEQQVKVFNVFLHQRINL